MKKINFKHPCKLCILFPSCRSKIKTGAVFIKLQQCEHFEKYLPTDTFNMSVGKDRALKIIKTYKIFKLDHTKVGNVIRAYKCVKTPELRIYR